MLQYLTVPVTPFQQNCSIVWCDATQEAAIIDAGGDIPVLLAEIKRLGLTLTALWVTHAHIDHAGAVGAVPVSAEPETTCSSESGERAGEVCATTKPGTTAAMAAAKVRAMKCVARTYRAISPRVPVDGESSPAIRADPFRARCCLPRRPPP